MKRVSVIGIVGALTLVPTIAAAQDQPWLQDRRFTEGIGYRAGDFELHPGAAAEFGFDSNYLHRDDGSVIDEHPISSLRLRITPSFTFETLGTQRREVTPGAPPPTVEFHGSLSATYNEFFPVAGGTGPVDRSQFEQQRNVGAQADFRLAILPTRPFAANLNADYLRTITPSNDSLPSASFDRDIASAGAELVFQPGGGLFDWRLGYQFQGTFFESSDYTGLDNLDNTIETRGRFRFLPRSALMFDGKFGFNSYPNANGGLVAGLPAKTDSHPVRAEIGYNGLITNWFALLALAGWGASFYTPTGQHDFDSVIGQAELRFYITPNPSTDPAAATLSLSSISVGFNRDFYDSYIGTYYEWDKGYAALNYFFGGKFLLQVQGSAGPVVYPPIAGLGAATANGFTDVLINAQAFAEYRIKDVIGINTTIRYNQNISSTAVNVAAGPGGMGGADSLAWKDFEAYIGVRWVM